MMKKRVLGLLFSFALILGLMPGTALTSYAADPVKYMAWNGSALEERTVTDYTVVTGSTDYLDGTSTSMGR